MCTVTFFNTVDELLKITGIDTNEKLWDAGFDLDDWDFGFVSDELWDQESVFYEFDHDYGKEKEFTCRESDWSMPQYKYWLIDHMSNRCVGYKHTELNGRHYYMAYHS